MCIPICIGWQFGSVKLIFSFAATKFGVIYRVRDNFSTHAHTKCCEISALGRRFGDLV